MPPRRIILLALALCLSPALTSAKAPEYAVLVMAHGGSPLWNKTVMNTVRGADLPYPTRVFFGMAHSKEEVDQLQGDVRYLEGKGAHTIIVIPLLVSSYSDVFRQWKYLLGAGFQPGFNTSFFPVKTRCEIQFAEPFNDDPIIGLVLLDRAREISQNPAQETVILVAHGPNDNSDNIEWLKSMQHLSETIRTRGKFKNVIGMTMRDDAPSDVRGQAMNAIRDKVEAIDQNGGRALVIPMLIAPGGIENKVGVALKGLDYSLNAKLILPDARISQWIRSKVP